MGAHDRVLAQGGATARAGPALIFLFALFFLSGFSALVYQIAWHRMLGLFGGADSVSAAIVVGAFLLGLGVGSLIAGLYVDRLSRRGALVLFAACELGIALFAALSPWLLYDVVHGGLAALAASRLTVFLVVFAALLWPTFLMGCSLPLLGKAIVRDITQSAGQIGWLYGVNTFGAGVGALASGWLIIGHVGYAGAIYIAAVLNVVVAAGGALLATGRAGSDVSAPTRGTQAPAVGSDNNSTRVLRWCALVFVSGFLIVGLQIVWYRLIGVLTQSNAYSFSLVLGVFLIGDAAGLMVGARIVARIRDPLGFFRVMQVATMALATLAIAGLVAGIATGIFPGRFVENDIFSARLGAARVLVLTALIVLPSSFVMGFSFPVVQRAVQTDLGAVGRRVGLVQLANIVGNSAGSLVTGLLLLHWVGTTGALLVLGGVAALFGVTELARGGHTRIRRGALAGFTIAVVALPLAMADGAAFWRHLHATRPDERAWVAEDRTGLAVLRLNARHEGRLYIQGHSQSCVPFCTVHAFLGAIGPLTHPDPRDVLVIGVGSGGTPWAAGLHPATRSVRAIEIVAPVLDTLRQTVSHGVGNIGTLLDDSRFAIKVGDGRHALLVDQSAYDVIEADAILPKSSLSGLLYSREFFEQVRARLKPGGLYVQWAPTERSITTFRTVFPHVVMVHPALIGSDRPIPYDADRIRGWLHDGRIRDKLQRARVDADELESWFRDKHPRVLNSGTVIEARDINSDLFPRDEYYLNRRAGGNHGPR